jgi:hydrogenase maturation protease
MTRILVAGVGNIFRGDDAFGVEVARALAGRALAPEVDVVDFGVRGIDLAYALMDRYEIAILVDAAPRGEPPGTVSVVEPHIGAATDGALISAHDFDPATVLRSVAWSGGVCRKTLLVACEPEMLGGEEGAMGLSETVAAAVEPAARLVERLVASLREAEQPMKGESDERIEHSGTDRRGAGPAADRDQSARPLALHQDQHDVSVSAGADAAR